MKLTAIGLLTLGTSFNALFQGGLGQVESQRGAICTDVPSSTATNEYGWLGKLPGMREWLGDRVINGVSGFKYSIKNKDWELTVAVDRNDIEDDNIGIYNPLFTEMGMSTMAHPDELAFELLKNGHVTECYDGQNFFDTDHPVKVTDDEDTTVSNYDGGAGSFWCLIDDTRAVKPIIFQNRKAPQFVSKTAPTDDNVFNAKQFVYGVDSRYNVGFGFWQFAHGSRQTLNAANYAAARAAMQGMKGDFGRPLGIKPSLLIVSPDNEAAALEILNAERDAAGATNVWRGTAKLLVTSWLA